MGMCCETRRSRRQRRWTSLTCMDASFQVLTRAGHPWCGPFVMGLVDAGRTPPTVGCRTRETERRVKKDAARPRVIRWGMDCWGGCYEGSGCPTTSSQASALENDAACPGCVASALGEAARGEAAGPRCDRRPTHDRRRSSAQGEQRQWENCET